MTVEQRQDEAGSKDDTVSVFLRLKRGRLLPSDDLLVQAGAGPMGTGLTVTIVKSIKGEQLWNRAT